MEPTRPKISVKDFFLNIGATVSMYTVVVTLVMLMFTVINVAYPKIVDGYVGSSSISWPVAVLFVFTPLLVLLMWLLEKQYKTEPERKGTGIHKWIMYATLFLSGLAITIDLITILYYYLDGQDIGKAFVLKSLVLLIVAAALFFYYISDILGKLNSKYRLVWRVVAVLAVAGAIVWGFSVLGSPQTQRLYKYDDTKARDLMLIDSAIGSYYSINNTLPRDFSEIIKTTGYAINQNDSQTNKPYEYVVKSKTNYELCADFNKETKNNVSSVSSPYVEISWTHPAGHYCFEKSVSPEQVKIKITQ